MARFRRVANLVYTSRRRVRNLDIAFAALRHLTSRMAENYFREVFDEARVAWQVEGAQSDEKFDRDSSVEGAEH